MPGMDATISGRYGPMELSAVCSARERKARSRSWRMGSGVWSSADEEVDEESESMAKRSLSASEEEPGGLGGGVGKVWYFGIEGRRIAARVGMGAPAWNEPEDLESNRGWLVVPGADRELLLMEGRAMMPVSACFESLDMNSIKLSRASSALSLFVSQTVVYYSRIVVVSWAGMVRQTAGV